MVDRAKVTSLEAVDSFRTSLVLFIEKAGRILDEVSDEVRRTRIWVQQEQKNHWLQEKRRGERKLEQAEQELFSSRLSPMQDASTEAQMHVRRARRALGIVDQKLRVLKKWERDYDSEVEPLARRLDSMQDLVKSKYPKAIAYLVQMLRTLEDYSQTSPSPLPPTESDSEG